jgi:hypothetical protein
MSVSGIRYQASASGISLCQASAIHMVAVVILAEGHVIPD